MTASKQALAAVRAFKNAKRWGDYATRQFLTNNDAWKMFSLVVDFEVRRHK